MRDDDVISVVKACVEEPDVPQILEQDMWENIECGMKRLPAVRSKTHFNRWGNYGAVVAALAIVAGGISVYHAERGSSNATNHQGGAPGLVDNGTSTNHSNTIATGDTPLQSHPVNGCDPAHSVYGPFCISTVPVWTQSSAGLTEWSQIEVGATVEVKGASAVSTKTRKPYYHAVEITGPGGFKTALPIDSNGGFDQKVSFPREGTYQMGVVQGGKPLQGLYFQVFYVPHPEVETTLTNIFPNSQRKLPHDIVLTFPYGTHPSVSVQFTTANGHVASGVQLHDLSTVIKTDAKGVAKVELQPGQPFLGINRIYGALFSLPYLTGRVSHGAVMTWPKETQTKGIISPPSQIVRGGVTYYEVTSALPLLDPVAFYHAYAGDVLFTYDRKTGDLTFRPNSTALQVTLTTVGTVKIPNLVCSSTGCNPGKPVPVAHVHPLMHNGKLYLDVHDLVTVLNTFAWASLSPNGTLRVADFIYP